MRHVSHIKVKRQINCVWKYAVTNNVTNFNGDKINIFSKKKNAQQHLQRIYLYNVFFAYDLFPSIGRNFIEYLIRK